MFEWIFALDIYHAAWAMTNQKAAGLWKFPEIGQKAFDHGRILLYTDAICRE
jgi:hypothetical protein